MVEVPAQPAVVASFSSNHPLVSLGPTYMWIGNLSETSFERWDPKTGSPEACAAVHWLGGAVHRKGLLARI